MVILITGGLGFIGANLSKALVNEGYDVVLFDIATDKSIIRDLENKVKIVRGDLSSWSDVLDTIKKYNIDECIFHMGALLSAAAESNPSIGYRVDIEGTYHVLEAARIFNVNKLIFYSSIASFGSGVKEPITARDTPQRPITIYGISKVFGELMCEYYHSKYDIDCLSIRLPSVIGPGRGAGGYSAYSSLMIQEPALGRPYKVFVKENTRMAILYIKDAIRASILAFKTSKERKKTRVYNIAGIAPSAGEIAETVKEIIPSAKIEFDPDPVATRVVESWPKILDEKETQEELGYKGEYYDLNKLITDFINEVQLKREILK